MVVSILDWLPLALGMRVAVLAFRLCWLVIELVEVVGADFDDYFVLVLLLLLVDADFVVALRKEIRDSII